MTATHTLLTATALLGLAVTTAQAQDALTVTGQGENFAVSYAPGYTGNILGGGFATIVDNGQNSRIVYADATLGRRAMGLPAFTGGEEGGVVYLPVPVATFTMAGNPR